MMNQMQPQMGGTPELTEEELRKLAMLLQQIPAGEGLATINQDEAELMKSYGGSGTPLPGTQGLGPDGGPVRSFQEGMFSDDGDYDTSFGNDSSGGSSAGGDPGQEDYGGDSSGSSSLGNDGFAQDPASYDEGDDSPHPGLTAEEYHNLMTTGSIEGTTGDGDGGGSTVAVAPPPKYKDMNGTEFDTQDEADASTAAIKAAMSGIEGQTLTTDSTYVKWLARNKDNPAYAGLTDAQKEAAYTTALTKSQEAAAAQVPKMVETMNNFFATTDADGNKLYGENTTFEEFKAAVGGEMPANLSEATLRDMYANAITKFQRGEAFTLTPEEVAAFIRPTIQTASVSDAEGVTLGTVSDATTTDVGEVTDVTAPTIDPVSDATATDVGEVSDVTATEVAAIASVTDADMDAIFEGGIDEAEKLLLARVNGTADSPAERQLMRTTEKNLRMLLGATAGGDADPAKVRQLKNIWQDMTQVAIGEAADLRSKESLAAESQLVELYTGKSTMKLNVRLANMEKDKQVAFKNGDLALAGKLANQQTALQRVITQASLNTNIKLANLKKDTELAIEQGNMTLAADLANQQTELQRMITKATLDTNIKLANLQKAIDLAVEKGKLDLATSLANLQKNLTIATVDAKLAVTQRSLDDALAIANFQGEQALYGLEAQIDIETMKADLTEMGFDLQRDLAELDSATQLQVAELTKQWREAAGDDQKQGAIIGALGSILAAWAKSDIRAKTNISPGAGEVESFLDALNSYKYEYKDENAPGADAGMFVGVMAQDLEKSAMGASFVKDTPNGKMVDYGHGLAAILASQANIHDRLRHLEEG